MKIYKEGDNHMVFTDEFIWHTDHFVYHITEKSSIESILKTGLIPMVGARSNDAGDTEKAVYFFDNLYNLESWMNYLYKNKDKDSLEVLRFNLKRLKWYIHNGGKEFYLKNMIPLEKLQYLILCDENNILIPYSKLSIYNPYELKYNWIPLSQYNSNKKLKKEVL